jgi:hypothetical protein
MTRLDPKRNYQTEHSLSCLTFLNRIPATYMRGGTSKGVFFRLQDLPIEAQTPGAGA